MSEASVGDRLRYMPKRIDDPPSDAYDSVTHLIRAGADMITVAGETAYDDLWLSILSQVHPQTN